MSYLGFQWFPPRIAQYDTQRADRTEMNNREVDFVLALLVLEVDRLNRKVHQVSNTEQADVDEITASITAYQTNIQAELDALETQILAGQPADLTALKAAVSTLPTAPDNVPAAPTAEAVNGADIAAQS